MNPSFTELQNLPLVRLELLGAARMLIGTESVKLERRTAAVLTYLALEGEAVKYQLAGWLWADSPETTARNNMRQLLRRLRQASSLDLIEGDDRIRLTEHLTTDAAELQAHAFAGDHAKVLEFEGSLLEGLEFDDCPDFEEWLSSTRSGFAELRRAAAMGESERLEMLGDLNGALKFADQRAKLEPLSEDAHRQIMRLHYLNGNRNAALAAFAECERILDLELGVKPLPETLALRLEIERGANLPQAITPVRNVPISVLRPPVLAGREHEWAKLEAAWDAGQFIAITGEAGTGKSRLMMDFVTSKVPRESVLLLQSRPGDASVPYSSHARNWRVMLEQFKPSLEPWVRLELARMLPELGESPGPIRNDNEKLRFYQAKLESMAACVRAGLRVLVSDDVQFTDPASAEASLYLMGSFPSTGLVLRALYAARIAELSPSIGTVLQQGFDAGFIAHVPLEPLDLNGIGALLQGLNLPGAIDLIEPVRRYTGGNPLFVLETVRHLFETGQLERGWVGRLPPPGKVAALVQRRLDRLSKPAQGLAQAAAILKQNFSLDLTTKMTGIPSFEALEAWAELETAQVMTGEHFSHDLIFESIAAGMPESTRRFLNRRAAEVLEAHHGDPARIAGHLIEGGETARAAPWLQRAAQVAKEAYRFTEAAEFFGAAAREFEASAERSAAFQALYERSKLLPTLEGNHADETERLLGLATTPLETAMAWHSRALTLEARAEYLTEEKAARNGLEYLEPDQHPLTELGLHETLGTALWYQGHYLPSLESFERTIVLAQRLGDAAQLAGALNNAGTVLGDLNRFEEATQVLQRAKPVAFKLEDRMRRAEILVNLAKVEALMGQTRDAITTLLEARAAIENMDGVIATRLAIAQALGTSYRFLADYNRSLEEIETGLMLAKGTPPSPFWEEVLTKDHALTLVQLGALEEAEIALAGFLERENAQSIQRGLALMALARLRAAQGRTHAHLFAQAEKLLDPSQVDQALTTGFLIARSPSLPALEALQDGIKAEKLAIQTKRIPQQLAALTRQAQALLRLERPSESLEKLETMCTLHTQSDIATLERSEILFTHFQVLKALNDPRASDMLQQALDWVMTTARDFVPERYKHGFLEVHNTHRAILVAARA